MFQLDEETGLFKGTLQQFLEHFCSLEEAAIQLHGSANEPVVLIETPEVFDRRVRILEGEVVTVMCEHNMEPTGGLDEGTLFSRMSVSSRYGRGLRSCPGCYSIVVMLEGDVVTVCKPAKCAMCLRAKFDVPKTDYQWQCCVGTTCSCEELTPCVYFKDKIMIEEQENPFDKRKYYFHINKSGVNVRQKDLRQRKKVRYDAWKLLSYTQVKKLLDKNITSRIVGVGGPKFDRVMNGKFAMKRIKKKELKLLRSAGDKGIKLPYSDVMHLCAPSEDWWVRGYYAGIDGQVAPFSTKEMRGYVYVYCAREHKGLCKDLIYNGACCWPEVPHLPVSIIANFCLEDKDPVPACLYCFGQKHSYAERGGAGWYRYKDLVTLSKLRYH